MPELPETLDRFEIIRILGKGGMGTVYLARDQRLGRQVALKVLNNEDLSKSDRKGRFMREARTAASINHPNIATLYEVDETADGVPFIVMEFCNGETLSQRLRRRPLDAAEFLSIARQIAAGVAAAHDSGVVHRDIKSANIIIEPTGQVKILDFGLAKLLPREMGGSADKPTFESTSGSFFGTLHYLSPEQATGRTADERSDLFSVGVVLYQMATGQMPFNAESPLMVLDRIRDAEPEPFVPVAPHFPPEAARIIGRLLQKNPDDRFQNAQELLAALDYIEVPTVPMSSFHQTRSTIGRTLRRPRWIRLAVILTAFVAGGTAFYFVRDRGVQPADTGDSTAALTAPIRSMAVLPLENMSQNTKDEFLSVSLADALVTKLQEIPTLQVRPTSAVLDYHNKKIDPRTASQKLRVEGILEGRFLAAGDLVRVNLQLTDSRTGYNIWADSIDGKRENLLKLIDDVSSRTVSGLNEKLGVQKSPGVRGSEPRSNNPKAYEEYLKARALIGTFSPADHAAQEAALRKAIQLDPNFAAAYADLAIAISVGTVRGLETDPEALPKAEWYARQSIRLDPNLAQAHVALGRVFVRLPDRFRESVRENLAALRLNPNDTQALNTLVAFYTSTGDLPKAQCVGEKMVGIDPNANDAKTRGYWYINTIDPEGALKNSEFALQSKETELAGHDVRGLAWILLGNIPEAEREAKKAAAIVPSHYIGKSLQAMVAAARGDRVDAEAKIRSFEAEANRNHWAAIRVALCYAKLGDRAKALEWVNKSAVLGHHSWYELVKHPWFQSLQSDPEFQKVVAKVKSDLDDVRDDVVGVYQLVCK